MSWEEDFLVAVASLETEENRKIKDKKSKKQSKQKVASKSTSKLTPKKSVKPQPKQKSSSKKDKSSSSGQSSYKFKSSLFQMAEDSVRTKELLAELGVTGKKQTVSSESSTYDDNTYTPTKQDKKVEFDIDRALEDFERIKSKSGDPASSVYWSGYLDYLQNIFSDDDF